MSAPVRLPRDDDAAPGTWKPVHHPAVSGRMDTVSASVCCPRCGRRSYLDHIIATDGAVSPSVVCPHEGCDWHVYVVLEGWPP